MCGKQNKNNNNTALILPYVAVSVQIRQKRRKSAADGKRCSRVRLRLAGNKNRKVKSRRRSDLRQTGLSLWSTRLHQPSSVGRLFDHFHSGVGERTDERAGGQNFTLSFRKTKNQKLEVRM